MARSPVAVVTAAAHGIGEATAHRLAASGHRLVLIDVDGPALTDVATGLGSVTPDVLTLTADVTDEEAVAAAVGTAVARFGSVEALVNVVGGSRPGKTVAELEREEWDQLLALNLTSVFLCCRAVIPVMEAAGGGAVVNVSSGAGIRGMKANPGYCAAKAGVVALTRALAIDHGPNGVRVNCVAPGPVATPLMRRNRSEAEIAAMGSLALVGRIAEPSEVAEVIAWLVSERASYVMGQTIEVDGGPSVAI